MYLLKAKIKAKGAATYLPDFPIRSPREERIKMRLVLGTHSSEGLAVFRDVQAKVERAEIETRSQLRDPHGHQAGLFSDEQIVEMQQDATGVGCPRFQREAEACVEEFLAGRRSAPFSAIANEVLEAIPIRMTQIKGLLKDMKQRGTIAFDLPPRKRVPQSGTHISLVAQVI